MSMRGASFCEDYVPLVAAAILLPTRSCRRSRPIRPSLSRRRPRVVEERLGLNVYEIHDCNPGFDGENREEMMFARMVAIRTAAEGLGLVRHARRPRTCRSAPLAIPLSDGVSGIVAGKGGLQG